MNNGLRLTPKMIADLAEGYRNGKTTTELSKEFQISKATICRALRKSGIEPERKDNLFTPVELTDYEKEKILLDYRAGLKIPDLARKYKFGYAVLAKVLEDGGLKTKKIVENPSEVKDTTLVRVKENNVKRILNKIEQLEICEKFEETAASKIELATEYDIHVDTVSAILRRHNKLVKRYIPQEVLELICEEFANGETIFSLATHYGQNPETIKYWLTKLGLLGTIEDAVLSEGDASSPAQMTSAELRAAAKGLTKEMLEVLTAIARDPTAGSRTRITAAALILERGHGKSREEAEEVKDNSTASEKILQLLPDHLKKKMKK